MSLTAADILSLRLVIRDAFKNPQKRSFLTVEYEMRQLYAYVEKMQKATNTGFKSKRLNVLYLAKQIGLKLPDVSQ